MMLEPECENIVDVIRWVHVEKDDVWWPALVYESLSQLMKKLPRNSSKANSLRATIFLHMKRKQHCAASKVAFLLHYTTAPCPAVSITEDNCRDFFDYSDELEHLYHKHALWNQAYEYALVKLDEHTITNTTATTTTESSVAMMDKEKPVVTTTTATTTEEVTSSPSPKKQALSVISPGNASLHSPQIKLPNPECTLEEAWLFLETHHGWRKECVSDKLIPHYYYNDTNQKFTPDSLVQHLQKNYDWNPPTKRRSGRKKGTPPIAKKQPGRKRKTIVKIKKEEETTTTPTTTREFDEFPKSSPSTASTKKRKNQPSVPGTPDSCSSSRRKRTQSMVNQTLEKVSFVEDENWTILSDEQALHILKTQYSFQQPTSNGPIISPGTRDPISFTNTSELRVFLCKYGMCQFFTVEEFHQIPLNMALKKWIAYTHIERLKGETLVKKFETIETFSRAWRILQKIGFKYTSKGYTMPHYRAKSAKLYVDGLDFFESSLDLWVYLARIGIRNLAPVHKLSEDDLYALEFFLADSHRQYWNVFFPPPLIENEEKQSSQVDEVMNSAEEPQSQSESNNKAEPIQETQKLAEKEVLPERKPLSEEPQSQPESNDKAEPIQKTQKFAEKEVLRKRKLLSEEPLSQSESNDKAEPIQETQKLAEKEVLRKKINLGDLKPVETTAANDQMLSTPVSNNRKEERESLDSFSLKSGDFEEMELKNIIASPSTISATAAQSNEDVLRECLEQLSSSGTYYFGGKLKENERRIQNFLDYAIASYRQHEMGSTSILYVCGRPGTGKTSLVECCIKNWEMNNVKIPHLIINAPSISQERGCTIMDKLSNLLNIPAENVAKRLEFRSLILVIDEIDYLIQSQQLKQILHMASDPRCKLILIGISNEVGNVKYLPSNGNVDEEIVFEAYTADDLKTILRTRLAGTTSHVVAPAAIELISRKIAATSGDARRALDIMAKAVKMCLVGLKDAAAKCYEKDEPLVKLSHVMKAFKEGSDLPIVQTISQLPLVARVVLCVAIALSEVGPSWKVISMNKLRCYCAEATKHGILEALTNDQTVDTISTLKDAGLIIIGNNDGEPENWRLQLGVQLEDVEIALEKTLFQESFYRQLKSYVQNIDFDNE